MSGSQWQRDEYIVTLDLYLNHPEIVEDQSDPMVQEVASLIDRTPSAVALRLANYRHLDPKSTQGMSNVSQGCRRIWEEYHGNEKQLSRAANQARSRLAGESTDAPEHEDVDDASESVETGESTTLASVRQGQGEFRKAVLDRYDGQCLMCDVSEPGLLVAAHILPWSDFENHRGDPANGLLLCYTHHEAFDLGMFTLSDEYECLVRPDFDPEGDFLRETISTAHGDSVEFPNEPPSADYLKRYNERLGWWPPE